MTCEEILSALRELSSEKYKSNVVKLGIPEKNNIGVSTADIRMLAKKLGKSPQLADELWNTGYHEAKLLAVLLFDKKTVDLDKAEKLMMDVQSWDLCDHLCKNLILKVKGYETLIEKWCGNERLYYKRAAYTLIASSVVHEKIIGEEKTNIYLELIKNYSDDEREHVKKAISWALREIGKRDFTCQDKAVFLAYELKKAGTKAQAWIARDALKELEKLVKVDGRGRLISSDSQMGSLVWRSPE